MIGRRGFLRGSGLLSISWRAHAAEPERLVIAGASLVEIAFALGAGDRVIAVDDTATHPPEVSDLPSVGYFRELAPEGIIALRPSAVIVAADAEPGRTLELLEAAGIPVYRAPDAETPEEVPAKITFVASVLGLEAEGRALAADYRERLAAVRAAAAGTSGSPGPRALFVLTQRGSMALVGGRGTVPDEMLRAAGLVNAAAEIEGYKQVGPESIIGLAPDGVLMMTEHAARIGGVERLLSGPGFRQTLAGRQVRSVTMDGSMLMRLGPRTPEAIKTLARALGTAD